MSPEVIIRERIIRRRYLSPELQGLIERNASREAPFSVSRYCAVVIQPEHEQFGQIGQLEGVWPDYEVRFPYGHKFSFQQNDLVCLDKTLLTEKDEELIVAVAARINQVRAGEQIVLSYDVVAGSIRHYLEGKYIDNKVVYTPSLQTRAHELHCPEERCTRLFRLLSLDDRIKTGDYLVGLEGYLVEQIKKGISREFPSRGCVVQP